MSCLLITQAFMFVLRGYGSMVSYNLHKLIVLFSSQIRGRECVRRIVRLVWIHSLHSNGGPIINTQSHIW